jgi:ribonucleoside-diphosphate reductase alpha chain
MWGMKDEELSSLGLASLRKEVMEHGVRNFLIVAAAYSIDFSQNLVITKHSTHTSNIYTRRVLRGEFIVVNKHLLNDLVELGLWNETLKQELITTDRYKI